MANGEVINQVRELIKNPKGLSGKTAQIMTLTLLADLYDKWEEDHKRVESMEPIVNAAKWIGGALGLANIALLVSVLTHTFKFP